MAETTELGDVSRYLRTKAPPEMFLTRRSEHNYFISAKYFIKKTIIINVIISKLYSGVRPRFKVFAKEKSGLHRRLFSYYHSIKLTNCQAHWLFLCVFHGLDLSRAHLHEVSFIACSLSILASAYGI